MNILNFKRFKEIVKEEDILEVHVADRDNWVIHDGATDSTAVIPESMCGVPEGDFKGAKEDLKAYVYANNEPMRLLYAGYLTRVCKEYGLSIGVETRGTLFDCMSSQDGESINHRLYADLTTRAGDRTTETIEETLRIFEQTQAEVYQDGDQTVARGRSLIAYKDGVVVEVIDNKSVDGAYYSPDDCGLITEYLVDYARLEEINVWTLFDRWVVSGKIDYDYNDVTNIGSPCHDSADYVSEMLRLKIKHCFEEA